VFTANLAEECQPSLELEGSMRPKKLTITTTRRDALAGAVASSRITLS
jgi:hypothetical protein